MDLMLPSSKNIFDSSPLNPLSQRYKRCRNRASRLFNFCFCMIFAGCGLPTKKWYNLNLAHNKQTLKALYITLCMAILLAIKPASGEAAIVPHTDTLKRQNTDTTAVLTAKERAKKEKERRQAVKAAEKVF